MDSWFSDSEDGRNEFETSIVIVVVVVKWLRLEKKPTYIYTRIKICMYLKREKSLKEMWL